MGSLKAALQKGDISPEVVGRMIFSGKRSEMAMLYKKLPPEGRAAARAAVASRMFNKAATEGGGVSPEKFKSELARLGSTVGVFFGGDDLKAMDGMRRALELTSRAGQSGVALNTGERLAPWVGGGALASSLGGPGAVMAVGGLGATTRLIESAPVRDALIGISRTVKGSPEEAAMLKRFTSAVQSERGAKEQNK